VPVGQHSVALSDVQANCSVTEPNPRAVTVEEGTETKTRFEVTCQ
jgi:hypothetical protein